LKNKLFHIVILLSLLIFSSCFTNEKEIIITGNIKNQEYFDSTNSEIQLTPLMPGSEFKVDNFQLKFDQGKFVSINYNSDYPSLKLNGKNKFVYKVNKILPGKYIIGVHYLIPKYDVVFGPSDPELLSRAFKTETGQYIIIEAKKEILPPLKIKLNDLTIPLDDKKMIINRTFTDHKLISFPN
jgi:hypothetical protein